MKERKKGKGKI